MPRSIGCSPALPRFRRNCFSSLCTITARMCDNGRYMCISGWKKNRYVISLFPLSLSPALTQSASFSHLSPRRLFHSSLLKSRWHDSAIFVHFTHREPRWRFSWREKTIDPRFPPRPQTFFFLHRFIFRSLVLAGFLHSSARNIERLVIRRMWRLRGYRDHCAAYTHFSRYYFHRSRQLLHSALWNFKRRPPHRFSVLIRLWRLTDGDFLFCFFKNPNNFPWSYCYFFFFLSSTKFFVNQWHRFISTIANLHN